MNESLVEIVESSNGPMLLLKTDTVISKAIRDTGDYAADEKALLDLLIDSGATIVDAGANIGNHTLFFIPFHNGRCEQYQQYHGD